MMTLGEQGAHPHALSHEAFNGIFGHDLPVVINFHGYPRHCESLLFSRNQSLGRKRVSDRAYYEGVVMALTQYFHN